MQYVLEIHLDSRGPQSFSRMVSSSPFHEFKAGDLFEWEPHRLSGACKTYRVLDAAYSLTREAQTEILVVEDITPSSSELPE